MLVLGVDPGSHVTGYGLVEKKAGKLICIASGQVTPSSKTPFYDRIHRTAPFF